MTAEKPRICFGMTLYNNAEYLPEAIESLLSQSYSDFFLVAVDDCSSDETEQIMRKYEAEDERVTYYRNSERLGLIDTWRLAFQKSFEMYNPEYFAWASDHDRWHKEWLFQHVRRLNKHPETSLVYPRSVDISASGETISDGEANTFETFGMAVADRVYHSCTKQAGAGYAVYGLFRAEHLRKAGVFRRVALPDRLLLMEISAYGAVRQIPKKLWYRRLLDSRGCRERPLDDKTVEADRQAVAEQKRIQHDETLAKQAQTLFGGGPAPLHAHCPFISHVLSLLLHLSILPTSGDRGTFWRGLLMASSLWERYRDLFIEAELEKLKVMLASKSGENSQLDPDYRPVELDDELTSNIGFTKEIGVLAASLLSRAGNTSDQFLSELKNIIILCTLMNHDSVRNRLRSDVRALERKLNSVQQMNQKLTAANENLKRRLSMGLASRLLDNVKRRFER